MSNKIYYLAVFFLLFLASCSSSDNESSSAQEVVFDDGYKTATNDEVIIDDSSFEGKEAAIATSSRRSSQEIAQIAGDGSQIKIMYDNLGNKTETRTFDNSLLKFVLLRTAADGSRQVFVYGQNGQVKSLPDNMLDKVLTAPSNELANAAGIFEGVKQPPSFTQSNQTPTVTTLKPLPSSQFPIRNQQTEQPPPPTEDVEQPSDNIEKQPAAENKDEKPSAKTEAAALDNKSDEKL